MIGTGWLGWTEQQTLNTSIPAIEIAWEGRLEMLRVMQFGPGALAPVKETPPPAPAVMSAKTAFAIFRSAAKPKP